MMTFRERTISTFKKEKVDRIVWQPRIEHWHNVNKKIGTLPEKYKDKTILQIFDDLNASVRYYGGPFLKFKYKNIKRKTEETPSGTFIVTETPLGTLTEQTKTGEHGCSSYPSEFPVKTIEDIKIIEYILSHQEVEFDHEAYQDAEDQIAHRGVTQFYYPRAPLQRLIMEYMGFENTIYALHDHPNRIRDFLKVIEEADDKMYEVLEKCPAKILNFGENIDANLDSPDLFKQYLIPYYKKRIEQLHRVGKFCHIHMDGALKPLLPIINEAGFDGIEAATPLPQGDVELEELKEAMGDTILLDGIPAILFLPYYSNDELEEFTLKTLELFSPNLILGISDEISPVGDIEKVRLVSQIVDTYQH